ncbi:hypothetical protein CANMA_000308 [Candida margitis]|uniref:uncharacterized protein n=1 Tax=Candida margitis TaxID=1775924 RepID=UPI002225E40A|nr:uncharacterized protein CANMA_000308 [Candida margitis]KAI5970641.1 hypothetical protein CANMA_000308 [Candida margitis]
MSPITTKMSAEPKQTIYINNINDKVSINKVKSELGLLLQQCKPTNISLAKTLKLKGQAFITFHTIYDASKAIENLNNKEVFSKRINATFAEQNSDALLDKEELKQVRKVRQDEYKIKKKQSQTKAKSKTKQNKTAVDKGKTREQIQIDIESWKALPPNRRLLLQNISSTVPVTKDKIDEYFHSYTGFEMARFVGVRHLSFIEFENEEMAMECLQSVDEKDMKEKFGDDIVFSYAKK